MDSPNSSNDLTVCLVMKGWFFCVFWWTKVKVFLGGLQVRAASIVSGNVSASLLQIRFTRTLRDFNFNKANVFIGDHVNKLFDSVAVSSQWNW